MTFDEWWATRPDGMDIVTYDTASDAWDAATRQERERCAKLVEADPNACALCNPRGEEPDRRADDLAHRIREGTE